MWLCGFERVVGEMRDERWLGMEGGEMREMTEGVEMRGREGRVRPLR